MRKPTRSISGVSANNGGVLVRVAVADWLVLFGMVPGDGNEKRTKNPVAWQM